MDNISHCPECHGQRAEVRATVSAFRYERRFYCCSECGTTFTGSWTDVQSGVSASCMAPAQVASRESTAA